MSSPWLRPLFLLFLAILPQASAAPSFPQLVTQAEAQKALDGLAQINGFEVDPTLVAHVSQFLALPPAASLDQVHRAELLEKQNMALWAGAIEEFIGLADLIFDEAPNKLQQQKAFDEFRQTLTNLSLAINRYVLAIHPGFAALDSQTLAQTYSGRGVTIAVFDVFDPEILLAQKKLFPKAQIDQAVSFGQPLVMNHGNTVIDIILRLAPEVHIVPVWSDAKDYAKALEYIVARADIDVVNMSRAFAESPDHLHIEPSFKTALQTLVKTRIVCKALGNTGTDLLGNITQKRVEAGLGAVNNLATYDLKLIADLYALPEAAKVNEDEDLLLFALNLSLFADDVALSASIPGDHFAVQNRTLGVPAEGIWSPSIGTFESGSSFASPQLAGLSALLLEASASGGPPTLAMRQAVVKALKESAQLHQHRASDWGRGLPSGDRALLLK